MATTDAQIDTHARSLTSVYMTEQWMGAHVYKVGDAKTFKMFAILNPGKGELTVKLADPEIATLLIEAEVARRNAHMPRGGWVTLLTDRLESDDVCERLSESHRVCAGALSKVARKKFGIL